MLAITVIFSGIIALMTITFFVVAHSPRLPSNQDSVAALETEPEGNSKSDEGSTIAGFVFHRV